MASQKIELSLTESFAKHKRNLLFVSALVTILAVASPETVKIPGMSDSLVPGPVAYFLLGAALIYFFSTYWVELLAVRARNIEITADNTVQGVADRLNRYVDSLREQIDSVIEKAGQEESIIKEFHKHASERVMNVRLTNMEEEVRKEYSKFLTDLFENGKVTEQELREVHKTFSGVQSNYRNAISHLGEHVDHLASEWERVVRLHSEISSILSGIEVKTAEMNKKVTKISHRISLSQRLGFTALEQAIPILLATFALVICIDGAFNTEGVATWARNQLPALTNTR